MKIIFENGKFKTEKKGFVQYDYGQSIVISGLDFDEDFLVFQFIKNKKQIEALGTKDEEGNFVVGVPDEFLQTAGNILVYCFYKTVEQGQTENQVILDVLQREMYEPEEPQPYHDLIAEILERLASLQYQIDHFELTPEQLASVVEQVEAEIDLDDYYDKQEVDNLLSDKANVSDLPDMAQYYNKQETDDLLDDKADLSDIPDISGLATKQELTQGLSGKADKSELPDMTDYYTKSEVDNLIPDVSGLATKQELGTLSDNVGQAISSLGQGLNSTNDRVSALETGKADKSATYTKTEVDNLLADKADVSDLPDMTNYYTKTETYSKTEIDNILGTIQTELEEI